MPRSPTRAANAGGFLIAMGVIAGAVIGLIVEEPTIGVLAGFGIGTAIALAIWVVDRR